MSEPNNTKIRNATPANKEYALADSQGLSIVGCTERSCQAGGVDLVDVAARSKLTRRAP
jgi:hypothetical protein